MQPDFRISRTFQLPAEQHAVEEVKYTVDIVTFGSNDAYLAVKNVPALGPSFILATLHRLALRLSDSQYCNKTSVVA